KSGHAGCRLAVLDDRSDLFALFVMQHHHGADQVGTLCAARILAMTSRAVLFVERLALLGGGFVGSRPESEELARGASTAATTATPLPASSPRGRHFLLSQNQRGQEDRGQPRPH